MEEKLDLGITLDYDSHFDEYEPVPNVVPLKKLIPDNHQYLFAFLQTDMVHITDLVRDGVLENNPGKVSEAYEALLQSHPFFENDPLNASAYINRTLAGLIWKDKESTDTQKKFLSLAINLSDDKQDIYDWAVCDNEFGYGTIEKLEDVYTDVKDIVYLLLNDSNPELSSIPYPVRTGIFGLLSSDEPSIPLPKSRIVLPYPDSMGVLRAAMDFDEEGSWEKTILSVRDLQKDSGTVPPFLKSLAWSVKDISNIVSYVEYSTEYLEEILYLEVYRMIEKGVKLKKCLECGNFYPVFPGSEPPPYCDIPGKCGISCLKKFLEKKLNQDYRRAYRTHYARTKAGTESVSYLNKWREETLVLKEKAINGEISAEEFHAKLL